MFRSRSVAACLSVLALLASGCGGGSDSSGDPESTSSAASDATAKGGDSKADREIAALQEKFDNTRGRFSQSVATVDGKRTSWATGAYDLQSRTLSGVVRIRDTTSNQLATARVRYAGDTGYLQVAQWDSPANGCWLKGTPEQFSNDFALTIADDDAEPLVVSLLDDFEPRDAAGEGVYQGLLDITDVVPLVEGDLGGQLVSQQPAGKVAAFITVDERDTLTMTVPGYELSRALSNSLKIEETKLGDISTKRYVLVAKPGDARPLGVPTAAKQMTAKQLAANTCG